MLIPVPIGLILIELTDGYVQSTQLFPLPWIFHHMPPPPSQPRWSKCDLFREVITLPHFFSNTPCKGVFIILTWTHQQQKGFTQSPPSWTFIAFNCYLHPLTTPHIPSLLHTVTSIPSIPHTVTSIPSLPHTVTSIPSLPHTACQGMLSLCLTVRYKNDQLQPVEMHTYKIGEYVYWLWSLWWFIDRVDCLMSVSRWDGWLAGHTHTHTHTHVYKNWFDMGKKKLKLQRWILETGEELWSNNAFDCGDWWCTCDYDNYSRLEIQPKKKKKKYNWSELG